MPITGQKMRYWDDDARAYIDADVVWSGVLHRQDEAGYALLGPGWQVKEHVLQKAAPKRDVYPTSKEIRKARLLPADHAWRSWRPNGTPTPTCQRCGRATLMRRKLCAVCTSWDRAEKRRQVA